jgi:hypothetical protein
VLAVLLASFAIANPIGAYTTNMSASVVLGQASYTTSTSGVTDSKFSTVIRGVFVDSKGRLIIADQNNHRVLIWNTLPTTSNTPADLVLGQPNFTSNTVDNGGRNYNTLSSPNGVFSTGDQLFVSEDGSSRVLIWNTFPTQNGQSANVVVGQALATSSTTTCNDINLSGAQGLWVSGTKLFVASRLQNRVLVWNTIPTSNGAPANQVLGQADFTHCTALTTSAASLTDPRSVQVDSNGRLLVGDRSNKRILIWNTLPTISNQPAEKVLGQPDFTTGTSTTANSNTVGQLIRFYSSGSKLFVPSFNRVLIYSSFPSSNNASGDLILGQSSFLGSAANGGGSTSATGFSGTQAVFEYQNKLVVADEGNARVLIFDSSPPTGCITIEGPEIITSHQVNLTISAADDLDLSNLLLMEIANQPEFSGLSWEPYNTTKNWTLSEGEGLKTVYVRFKDSQGNISNTYSDNLLIDQTSPTYSDNLVIDQTSPNGSISIGGLIDTSTVTLNLIAEDPVINQGSSGLNQMRIGFDPNLIGAEWQPFQTSLSITIPIPSGIIYAQFSDIAGNLSAIYSTNLTRPTLKLIQYGTVPFNSDINRWYYTGHRPTFRGKADPQAKILLTIHSDPITCAATADSEGNWDCTPATDIPNGSHSVTIQTVNALGNYDLFSFELGINTGLVATGSRVYFVQISMVVIVLLSLGILIRRRLNL